MTEEKKYSIDIEDKLDDDDDGITDSDDESNKLKKYLKLVLPHVALVAAVCIYAVGGALVFHSIEGPHEDEVRAKGVATISDARELLLGVMWNNSRQGHRKLNKEKWIEETEKQLYLFSGSLYKSFQREFVRYKDVKVPARKIREKRDGRKSSKDGRSETKLWTTSSSIFFAATTMATIGYGNIVPVTSKGRLICVFFALFGAPLAIITIGDLGKFLSECTIWLYRKLKQLRTSTMTNLRRMRARFSGNSHHNDMVVTEICKEQTEDKRSETSSLDWEDLVLDKTQVPVVMVFAILLIYIALGAILFSVLEDWSYVDSFYFCFITLTTVGFGDLVPERHQYLLLMLLYIGVGLAVTTMCIDLVGIQYIQKIHYFGRKFRGTDLLQLLKRKRMIERRLAMQGGGEDILQMYLDQLQQEMPEELEPPPEDWNDLECDNVLTYEPPPKSPTPVRTPTPLSLCSSVELRAMLYRNRQFRVSSWTDSGPDISVHCSLSTSPTISIREQLYRQMADRSHPESVLSFGYRFDRDSPLPTSASVTQREEMYRQMADRSHPESVLSFGYRFDRDSPMPTSASETQREEMYRQMANQSPTESVLSFLYRFDKDSPLSTSPTEEQRDEMYKLWADKSPTESILSFEYRFDQDSPIPTSPSEEQRENMYSHWLEHSPTESVLSFKYEFPIDLSAIAQEAKRSRRIFSCPERFVPVPPSVRFINSRRSHVSMSAKRPHAKAVSSCRPNSISIAWLNVSPRSSECPTWPVLLLTNGDGKTSIVSPRKSPVGLSCMEDWESFVEMLEYSKRPYIPPPEVLVEVPSESDEDIEPPTLLSPLASIVSPFSSSTESLLEFPIDYDPESHIDSGCTSTSSPSEEVEMQPLYHKDIPVYATDAKPVDSQKALANAISCPVKYLSRSPPTMVTDNYCFVIDGDAVGIEQLTGNAVQEQWWKGTGKSIRYYWSQTLKAFFKVNILLAKGQVISARRRHRRSSTGYFFDRQVPLQEVYQVSRYYYYWKTSRHFHRIISVVSPIKQDGAKLVGFQRRIFVQYLWRDAKDSERLRVSLEYETVMRGGSKPASASPTASGGHIQIDRHIPLRRGTLSFNPTDSSETLATPSLTTPSTRMQMRRGTLGPATSRETLLLNETRRNSERTIKQSLSSTGIGRYL